MHADPGDEPTLIICGNLLARRIPVGVPAGVQPLGCPDTLKRELQHKLQRGPQHDGELWYIYWDRCQFSLEAIGPWAEIKRIFLNTAEDTGNAEDGGIKRVVRFAAIASVLPAIPAPAQATLLPPPLTPLCVPT